MRLYTAKPWLGLLIAVVMAASACGGSDEPETTAAALPANIDEACKAATTEGALTMWGGSDQEVAVAIFNEFAKTHPGIKYDYLALRPSEGAQRIITESAARRAPSVDLVSFEPNTVVGLIERGLIDQDIDWKTLGVPESVITSQNAILWSANAQGIVYNTNLVSAADLPTSWDDLLDPKWKGKIVVDPRGRPFDKLSLIWGDQKALDYVEKLKANSPIIIEGGTAGMVAVGSGEAAITTGGLTIETQEQQAKNAPVAFQYLDAITTEDAILSVIAKSDHINAAYCYAAWMGSDEGQDAIERISYGRAELKGLPEGAKVTSIQTPAQAESVAAMSAKIAEIWGNN
jgi:iron(III) transport system substrate-binding protein